MSDHSIHHPPLHLERLGRALTLSAVPSRSGDGIEILLGDDLGPLSQEVLWIPKSEIEKRRRKGEDLISTALASARDGIAKLDDLALERILATPRRREAFRWTPELLAAVHAIDWDTRPVAGFTQHGHDFQVTACPQPTGVLIVMRDKRGIFDASAWISKEQLGATPTDSPDVLAFGANGLGGQIAAMSKTEMKRFLASAARLPDRPAALN